MTNPNTGAQTMTVNEAITAILTLYATPGTWVQAGIAQDRAGREVAPDSPKAVAWSLKGALYRVIGNPNADGIAEAEADRRETMVAGVMGAFDVDLMAFNDAARRQSAIVSVLRTGRDCVSLVIFDKR